MVVVTLDQQYNVGEKPTVILCTYTNRHAGTPNKKEKKKNRNKVSHNLFFRVLVSEGTGGARATNSPMNPIRNRRHYQPVLFYTLKTSYSTLLYYTILYTVLE